MSNQVSYKKSVILSLQVYSVFNTAAAKFEVDLPSRIESLQDVPVKLVEDNADPDLVNFQWWAHPLHSFIFNFSAVFQKGNAVFFSFDIWYT